MQKGKEKLSGLGTKLGNTNLFDLKNSIVKLFCNAKSFFEKEKTEKEKSIDYIKKLLEIFKDLDDSSVQLLKMYITNFTLEKSKILAKRYPKKYEEETKKIEEELEIERKSLKKAKPINDEFMRFAINLFHIRKKYFIFHFEEFILVLCRFLRFIVGMHAKIEVFENKEVFIYFNLHKKALPVIAEALGYVMQTKPYAAQFRLFMRKKFEKGGKKKLLFKEEQELLVKLLKKNESFEDLNHEDQLKFPPYFCFERSKTSKFRKYCNDDDFHSCYKDPEFRRYNDIYKSGLFVDPDYQPGMGDDEMKLEAEKADEDNDEILAGVAQKKDKSDKKIKEFLSFEYKNDEDELCMGKYFYNLIFF